MKKCFVYVISSVIRNYLYVGLSNDVDNRIRQHQLGRSKTTRAYRPFKIILVEEFTNRPEARNREKYLKSGVGKEKIKKLIRNSTI